MVINPGQIYKDQTGQILKRGNGSRVLVLNELEDNEGVFNCLEIPYSDEEFKAKFFQVKESDLTKLVYQGDLQKFLKD